MYNMRICICICGLNRFLNLVLNKLNFLLKDHELNYILILSNYYENEYLNINNKNIFNIENIENNKIIKILYLNDNNYNNNFRNSLNYSNKIYHVLKIIEEKYNLYMLIRSDFILENINLENICNDKLYFSNKNINEYTNDKLRINDNIILTKNYYLLLKLLELHNFNIINDNYLDINLYKYLELNKLKYELIDIKYKLVLSECNIIAIAGDSGSGKTTLTKILNLLFKKDTSILETDRYHKWERGNNNYQNYTHLNPFANHLEKMYDDVYQLKIGKDIYQVDYDHTSGKFTQKQKIENNKNLILCGLHTLYQKDMNYLLDIKIYLDTERNLIKKWKIKRDINERNYDLKKILKQIEDREKDYIEYIEKQKKNSDIIIKFYEVNDVLKCDFIIKNEKIKYKILEKIIKLEYKIKYNNNNLVINLKNNIENVKNIDENINNLIEKNIFLFNNNYYKEILLLIYFYTLIN